MQRFIALLLILAFAVPAYAENTGFRVCWSDYVGWMPWGYAERKGIVEKWSKRYGIRIEFVQVKDYTESVKQFAAGEFDACTMTNIDALRIPAAQGVDTTALIVGSFSNGNDGVVLKGSKSLADIEGRSVHLVEKSVSHYLLGRALASVGLNQNDIDIVNTSSTKIVNAYSTPDVLAAVTWHPMLSKIAALDDSYIVFDSSIIPGEIVDLLVGNTKTLRENPKLGAALTGIWYEVMAIMSESNKGAIDAIAFVAVASGTDISGYQAQLTTTKIFYKPEEALAFVKSNELLQTMQRVAGFTFNYGLLGESMSTIESIGIETPAGIYGAKENIKLRFTPEYMQMIIDKKIIIK